MFSTKEIKRLYYNEKLSTRQIAKKINCPRSIVQSRLKHDGLRSVSEGALLRSTPEYRQKIGAAKIGEKNPSSKLTEIQVLKIRDKYKTAIENGAPKTEIQYSLAKKYNVKRPTISDIVLRKTWKHI